MSYYVIGIGGTGAKCVEALIHCCAAGMLDGTLHVMFVDPDQNNGTLGRVQTTLSQYKELRKVRGKDCNLAKANMESPPIEVWSPLSVVGHVDATKLTLDHIMEPAPLKTQNPGLSLLYDVLYSPSERAAELNVGFRGHPSIGAAVLARTIDLENTEPWRKICSDISNDLNSGSPPKIFLVGSIFGGTGAAGMPTIARLILDKIGKKLIVGGALMLPYFTFPKPAENDKRLENEEYATSDNFMLASSAALKYYHSKDLQREFDSLYFLGDTALPQTGEFAIGAQLQRNRPHYIELVAALSAFEFFANGTNDKRQLMSGRQQETCVKWSDLPDMQSGQAARQDLGALTKFAFAFESTYYPMMLAAKQGRSWRAPWFVDLVGSKQVLDPRQDELLEAVHNYCRTYLTWFGNLHLCAPERRIQFAQTDTFCTSTEDEVELRSSFAIERFSDLLIELNPTSQSDQKQRHERELGVLWDMMSRCKLTGEMEPGVSAVITNLYKCCEQHYEETNG